MLGIVGCKVMSTGKIFFGTHVNVVVLGMVKYCVQTYGRRNADGTGRQAEVAVSVVGRINCEVCIGDSSQAEVLQCKLYGGVSL